MWGEVEAPFTQSKSNTKKSICGSTVLESSPAFRMTLVVQGNELLQDMCTRRDMHIVCNVHTMCVYIRCKNMRIAYSVLYVSYVSCVC